MKKVAVRVTGTKDTARCVSNYNAHAHLGREKPGSGGSGPCVASRWHNPAAIAAEAQGAV